MPAAWLQSMPGFTVNIQDRNTIVLQWQPLVVWVVNSLWPLPFIRQLGTFDDAVQVGSCALIQATENYNPTHQSKAQQKTYFTHAIRKAIIAAAQDAGIIHVPRNLARAIHRNPAQNVKRRYKFVVQQAIAAMHCHSGGNRGDWSNELLPNTVLQNETKESLSLALKRMNRSSASLLKRFYGLSRPRQTLAQLSKHYGVSRAVISLRLKEARCELKEALKPLGVTTPSG